MHATLWIANDFPPFKYICLPFLQLHNCLFRLAPIQQRHRTHIRNDSPVRIPRHPEGHHVTAVIPHIRMNKVRALSADNGRHAPMPPVKCKLPQHRRHLMPASIMIPQLAPFIYVHPRATRPRLRVCLQRRHKGLRLQIYLSARWIAQPGLGVVNDDRGVTLAANLPEKLPR